MNVGIDITPIIYNRGVSRYTSNLVRALTRQPQLSVAVYGYSLRQKEQLLQFAKEENINQVKVSKTPQSLQQLFWQLGLHSVRKALPQIDVFHSWDWLQPPDKDLPLVSTIHDVAMLKFPETAHAKILKMHQRSWRTLKQRQAQIIAVSNATKRDVVNLLGIPKYQVHVIPEALPVEFQQTCNAITAEQAKIIKDKLSLNRPYLLAVGTREPRKNLVRLIEAWQPMADEYQLIIAGEKGWDQSQKFTHPNLRFLGRVADRELAVLYGEAELFCYPSLYEGFGLPILEAFFLGTPVVTSNVSSMPEVAGNAAVLVDPEDVNSIRSGIQTILNEDIQAQKKRLQRMIIRLQMFSWNRVAEETARVYQLAKE